MQTSELLFKKSQKIAPGGVHSPVRGFKGLDRAPVFFKSSKGATLTDVEGKTYIDYCQSFGPNILGHRDPDVEKKLKEIIEDVWTIGAAEPYSLELAEWMTERLPWAQKVRFVNSGTEAVMSALRLARGYTKRELVLKFNGCYHGHVDSMLVKAGSGLAGQTASSSAGVSESVANQTLIAELGDEEGTYKIIQQFKDQIAAIIIEPLPANNGLLIQEKKFLENLSKWAKEIGALLIFDEVISGFRVDIQGMAGLLGIKPDLVTYGKIIGGGFPVGCYAGKQEIMDCVAPMGDVYQAGTLSANPIGMVTGLATLHKLETQNIIPTLEKNTTYFASQVRDIFSRNNLPYHITQFQSLVWIHANSQENLIRPDQITNDQTTFFKNYFLYLLDRGIYMAPHAYEISFMSYAHDKNILDRTLSVIEDFAQHNKR